MKTSFVSLAIGLSVVSGGAMAKDKVAKMPSIKGKWVSEACESYPNPDGSKTYFKRLFSITDKTWAIDFSTFGDPKCSDAAKLLTVDIDGKYKLGKESSVSGGTEGEFMFSNRKVTPKSEGILGWLNPAKVCGFADWVVGKTKDIQKIGCAQLGAHPLKDCKGEYDIVKLEGDKLYFGARPADGNLCSPVKRAKEFGTALVRI
jgi:hypothetical protein